MIQAYGELVDSLSSHVMLCIPTNNDEYILYTDASGDGIGGCLHVRRGDEELPVAFFSRQLRPPEKNYSVTELESLAIVASVKHFDRLTYGLPLQVVTDHRACLALTTGRNLNRRLLRFTLALQDRPISLIYRPGKDHSNADAFSRQSWQCTETDTDGADSVLSAQPWSELGAGRCGSARMKK